MLVKYIILLPIMILVFNTAAHDICQFTVKVAQKLHNKGFHRNLSYHITLEWGDAEDNEVMWYYDSCVMGLQQVLEPGVYVTPEELSDLRRAKKLTAFPNNKVNVEMPAERAHLTRAYIFKQVSHNQVDTWLPLHARYHRAVSGGGYAENKIGPPSVFLQCPDARLEVCEMPITTKTYLCSDKTEKCVWKEVIPKMVHPPLVWKVPVGNLDHHNIVSFFTVATVSIGSMYLIKFIHEHKMAYRRKA